MKLVTRVLAAESHSATIGHHSAVVTRHALGPTGRPPRPFKTHAASRHPRSAGGGGGETDQGTFQGLTARKGETRRPAPAARWPGSGRLSPVGTRTAPSRHPSRKWGCHCPLPVSPRESHPPTVVTPVANQHQMTGTKRLLATPYPIRAFRYKYLRYAKKENTYRNWAIAIYDRQKEKHLMM